MNILTEHLDDHQVRLTVRIEKEQLDQGKRRAARKIAQRTKIPGFRPGKAPYNIVERMFGEAVILEEALESIVDELYPKVLAESAIDPYGPGSLENFSTPETDLPTFEFLVPLSPQVTVGDYHAIRIPYEYKEVGEEQIDEVIEQVRESQALIEPVDRPAESGDIVFIKMHANRRQPEEGQDPTIVKEQRLNILVQADDSQDEDEWPFQGFSQNMVGLSSGDTKTVPYTFPADHEIEAWQDLVAEFHLVVDEVKSRTLPAIDDELAQAAGDFETFNELREHVQKILKERALEEYHAEYDDLIIDRLAEDATVKYPPQMLEREIEVVREQLEDRLARQGLDLETYLKSRDMDEDALIEELRPAAEKRIQRGLLLMEVSRLEEIEVDPEEVQGEASRTINQLYQVLPKREARRRITGNLVRDLVGQIMSEKMIQQTLVRLRAIARGEYQETAVDEGSGDTESDEGTPDEAQPTADTMEAEEINSVESSPESADSAENDEQSEEASAVKAELGPE